ncbi:MAG: hypothetical protein HYV35_10400 [Lentisphaerae bacterium]|nr:hypothetical protein [Lentisphaerota bacterium]
MKFMRARWLLGLILACALPGRALAATVTWLPTGGTNDWFAETNWSSGTWPTNGDEVIIANANIGVLLTNSTYPLGSLVISNKATLIFSNWDTSLSTTNMTIAATGAVTCAGPFNNSVMSNRVWIVCTNLFINSGGKIDVSGRGYAGGSGIGVSGSGPGGGVGYSSGYGSGGGHGGFGGAGSALGGNRNGLASSPIIPGSGGGGGGGASTPGGAGGGAVLIQAGSNVTINGAITANGNAGGATYGGGGSGGSIYISCSSIAGTSGVLNALGGTADTWPGPGGGGRVALIYNVAAQNVITGLQVSTMPASGGATLPYADLGSLYLSDSRFLLNTVTNLKGQIYGFSSVSFSALTVSNCWLRFPENGFQLTVTNDLAVLGSSGRLELGGNTSQRGAAGYPAAFYCTNAGPQATIGGNLILSNSASFAVYSGLTNGGFPSYGALVRVTNTMNVGSGCWVYASSHIANGGSVHFLAGNLTIANLNSGFKADYTGFTGGNNGAGYDGLGPGHGWGAFRMMGSGAGYGGIGGGSSEATGGSTYGSSNAPVDAGSGGGGRDVAIGGSGGGLIWIQVNGDITQNGTISANGQTAFTVGTAIWGGGGSGGGIYLYARSFSSTNASAIIRANGGNAASATYGGGGGGGRIAIWRMYDRSGGITPTVTAGTGYTNGVAGTIFWGQIPLPGAIFSFH